MPTEPVNQDDDVYAYAGCARLILLSELPGSLPLITAGLCFHSLYGDKTTLPYHNSCACNNLPPTHHVTPDTGAEQPQSRRHLPYAGCQPYGQWRHG
ncbi:methyl-accepting chemotaxis protein (partial) [Erwinia amylovora MR1]|nr:methyl-accepting chemotaxis protein (partial) [Erwinia amylovora MR1]